MTQTEQTLNISKKKITLQEDVEEVKKKPAFDMKPDRLKISQRIKEIEDRRDYIMRDKAKQIDVIHARYETEDGLLRKEKYFLSSLLE